MSEILEILSAFEIKAIDDVNTDRVIDCDPYESIGKLKLIRAIIRKVREGVKV